MASAGKFLGAPAAQQDVFGGQATTSPVSNISNNPPPELQSGTICSDPLSILPLELVEFVFQFALPSLDIMDWAWRIQECHPYMATLYVLRRVSKAWRDVVDSTPSLWTVISSTFPEDVNRTSLARSGSSPLVIYFPGACELPPPPFRKFLPIIEPHLHRCGSLALQLDLQFVDEVPRLSPLRLVALKINIDMDPQMQPAEIFSFTKDIEISEEALENIRAVDLTLVPMDWATTLEHLRGLRTLALDGAYDDTITQEQIVNVLLASPGIETLSIIDMEIQDPPSSLSRSVEPLSLPQLQSITLMTDGLSTNGLLRRIRPPPDIIEFDIRPKNFPSDDVATSFWHETMAPWVPVVQQLYLDSDEPRVRLLPQAASCLQALSEGLLVIEFTGLTMARALLWIWNVIGAVADVEDGPAGFRIWTKDSAFESDGVLEILQNMPGLTEISVEPANHFSRPSLEPLLNVLAKPTTDSIDTLDPIPTFPVLQKLTIHNWMWELDDFMNMAQRRYSMRSTYRQQVPDLTLDISSMQLWMEPWREKTIIFFSDATALLELDGVREVRMGCVFGHSGTLAVIWDEEGSRPAWG